MKLAYISLFALSLAACASNPAATTASSTTSWTAYRAELAQQRDHGDLTPLQAEDKLETRYRELYGRDPTVEGLFAYRRELYAQAQDGNLPMDEAKVLAKARMDEVLARREADADFHQWMESRFPPEPSD